MQRAALPENEVERLAELAAYEILDTLPEQAYDDIVTIASQICDTPIALVSLVDEQRQWFKSRIGIEAQETPRDLAFCAHAILDADDVFVIEDAQTDFRFADNPMVINEPGIRFYAGAPLVTASGHALGTLCVIDRQSRTLTAAQTATLRALSRQVVAQLELRRTVKQLERNTEALQDSHTALTVRGQQLARSCDQLSELCQALERQAHIMAQDLNRAEIIQHSLLPGEPPQLEGYTVEALYRPGRRIGGDLYDVQRLGENALGLIIADASGHGVSAAMLSVLFKHEIQLTRRFTSDPLPPAEVMRRLNDRLLDDLQVPGAFVTSACGLLDLRTGQLSIASAGHTTVCLAHADGQIEVIPPTGPALGLFQDAQYDAHEYTLAQGDRLLMYTDGLADVGGDAPPGAPELLAAIVEQGDIDDRLQQAFLSVAQGQEREDRDDMTVLMLEAKTGKSRFVQLDEIESMQRLPNGDKPGALARSCEPDAMFLVISGRATWVLGETLLFHAQQAITARQTLIIDLDHCEYLDSTLLGTLHQIVSLARDANTQVELQCVGETVVEAFEELSLSAVIACIQRTARPLPDRIEVLNVTDVDESKQQQRLLRAHEVLMELSESNREAFAPVVDALREELL